MDTVDVLVIGAGVVGLAVARALAQTGREVVVLEQGKAIGQGVSSRNSEVIHAGLYYPPGSLKARLCVRGKALLYPYCESHGVAHRRCGKLVVATDEAQVPALLHLQTQARANGVPTEWLSAQQAVALEPQVRCVAALFSPSTGMVDSHALMLALQGDLEQAGGAVALDSRFLCARAVPGGFEVQVQSAGQTGPCTTVFAQELVNAASLHACQVARAIEGLDARHVPREYFAKGSYFSLSQASPFTHLIYPAPQDAWLGVHATLDLGGQCRFGPDLQWLDVQRPEQIDYRVEAARVDGFYAAVRRYWPGLKDGDLQAGYSGVRPKIHAPDQMAPDFLVQDETVHGVSGLVNLLGIESPGLTSALALGEHVRSLLPLRPGASQ